MKRTKENTAFPILGGLGMLILILDGKTAIAGAMEATELCIRVVIPTLFPFFAAGAVLTAGLSGKRLRWLTPLLRRCGIPAGVEAIFLTGCLGGYPVGAQSVGQACRDGHLQSKQAQRMLSICSNAGPAFLFGMAGRSFSSPCAGAWLWGIQILSALLTGWLLIGENGSADQRDSTHRIDVTKLFQGCVQNMACVCGWVILFRVILAFASRWLLGLLPPLWQILAAGSLELTNGCLMLRSCESEPLRFVLAAVIAAFGGVCVLMQTAAVAPEMRMGSYIRGKLVQAGLAAVLASFRIGAVAPGGIGRQKTTLFSLLIPGFFLILWLIRKITVAKRGKLVYNGGRN